MKRTLLLVALTCVMVVAFAAPAMAVSSITNYLTLSDQSISTNQKISCTAKTAYGWQYSPNPYTSSFYTEMNAYHFGRPVNTGWSGLDRHSWAYKSDEARFTKPCYALDSGTLWFGGASTVTAWVKFTDVAKSASSGSKRNNRHGQYQGGWDSYGGAVWRTTTHN
ncbi:MAG: hypothetical protein HY876_06580 [Coriobacteriales bacterium]|nr:hypothetical protein [Coriobacteriales bacterium]